MADTLGHSSELLASRLSKLIAMHDTLDAEERGFSDVVLAQTTAVWSNVGTTSAFAQKYKASLADLHSGIGALRARLLVVRETLIQNATQLDLVDANVQARLTELAARLDTPDATPAPATPALWATPAPTAPAPWATTEAPKPTFK